MHLVRLEFFWLLEILHCQGWFITKSVTSWEDFQQVNSSSYFPFPLVPNIHLSSPYFPFCCYSFLFALCFHTCTCFESSETLFLRKSKSHSDSKWSLLLQMHFVFYLFPLSRYIYIHIFNMTLLDPPRYRKLTEDRAFLFIFFNHHIQPSTLSIAERMLIPNERNWLGYRKP